VPNDSVFHPTIHPYYPRAAGMIWFFFQVIRRWRREFLFDFYFSVFKKKRWVGGSDWAAAAASSSTAFKRGGGRRTIKACVAL
jgi:hypothetical protein